MGVNLPSFAHVSSHESSSGGLATTLNELLLCVRTGLYLEVLSPLPQGDDPLYVDDGVANVDVLLILSKMDDIEVDVLDRLCGLDGVCVLGRLRYSSSQRAAPGRRSTKSS